MNYIDLFAGAGGLSEGFHNAGFTPVAHVEMDASACDTIRTRMAWYHLRDTGRPEVYIDYLRHRITRDELYAQVPKQQLTSVINAAIGEKTRPSIFAAIDEQLQGQEVDVIVGGPPCQAYSVAGRARLKEESITDPRNFLYVQYARFLQRYNPRMFVFENVLGLLSAKNGKHLYNIRRIVEKSGYQMEVRQFNASDYGVPQSRKRLIIIGWRADSGFTYPKLTKRPSSLVDEVLRDLPALQAGTSYEGNYTKPTTNYLRETGIRPVEWPVLTQHIARPHQATDIEIYRLAIEKWNTSQERLQYSNLPARLITHGNIKSFLDRFKVVAGNLTQAQTVVAHINRDGHYYIHPDYEQGRSLSVREAARLQTFPDDFYFEGSRTAIFKQIGNAVPPLLATEIGRRVSSMLNGEGVTCTAKPPKERIKHERPVVIPTQQMQLFPAA